MYVELEANAVEHGFLGNSAYQSEVTTTKPLRMQLMYFKSIEQYVPILSSLLFH